MITHYDLFAGIGGFSLALEEVFKDEPIEHIFCEWERFPTAVLKKHWPEAIYYGDIADLVTDTASQGQQDTRQDTEGRYTELNATLQDKEQSFSIVTGGFPCQPFSAAGRRRGTADDRYKWPEMFSVIRNVTPDWVVAENVRGLVTWNDGMVLETVCSDLESEGYEVQPIIIPAVSVGAPHRRDRVWIIAHRNTNSKRLSGIEEVNATETREQTLSRAERRPSNVTDSRRTYGKPRVGKDIQSQEQATESTNREYPDWERSWQEVAFATCDDQLDDGFSRWMDGTTISPAKWRKESLKAYGNAIVPQVAMEVFKAIKETIL